VAPRMLPRMMDMRAEHAEREAHIWGEFEQALARIPRERWTEPDVLPDWSVTEMLWHVAGWLDECSTHLEQMIAGTFEDVDEGEDDTDERNAGFATAARGMEVDTVWSGLLAARERVRQRWFELPETTDRAVEEFASETYQHYKEHLPDLETFSP
jgi:mycothiol maleylpyruvate isomerase-like protein